MVRPHKCRPAGLYDPQSQNLLLQRHLQLKHQIGEEKNESRKLPMFLTVWQLAYFIDKLQKPKGESSKFFSIFKLLPT